MAFAGGFSSTLQLSNTQLDGNLPAQYLVGGYGTTTGSATLYELALNPPVSQLPDGLTLKVRFHVENAAGAQLSVDGIGTFPLVVALTTGVVPIAAAHLKVGRPYAVILSEGQGFVRPETLVEPLASTTQAGFVPLATETETRTGTVSDKAVTPSGLQAYLGELLTGRWKDRGLFDASSNPPFPAGVQGEAYIISGSGRLGDTPPGSGMAVQVLDVLYCAQDNPGGDFATVAGAWIALEGNKDLATETMTGLVQLATTSEVGAGTDRNKAITPGALMDFLTNWQPTQTRVGVARLATQTETAVLFSGNVLVTPSLLKFFQDRSFLGRIRRGVLDASLNPPFPFGQAGDVLLVTSGGKVGGPAGRSVRIDDLLICKNNTVGGDITAVGDDWITLSANLETGSKTETGLLAIASDAEAASGLDIEKAVNPAQLQAAVAAAGGFTEVAVPVPLTRFHPDVETLASTLAALNDRLISVRAMNIAPQSGLTFPWFVTHGTPLVNFPKPQDATYETTFFAVSSLGNVFEVRMDAEGQVSLDGQFTSSGERVDLRIAPYLAQFPLQYAPNLR